MPWRFFRLQTSKLPRDGSLILLALTPHTMALTQAQPCRLVCKLVDNGAARPTAARSDCAPGSGLSEKTGRRYCHRLQHRVGGSGGPQSLDAIARLRRLDWQSLRNCKGTICCSTLDERSQVRATFCQIAAIALVTALRSHAPLVRVLIIYQQK